MNGAESLVHTLIGSGIDTCFANPGTSEMHFVAALDRIPGIKCVLGLQENVVTGMADGYFRIAEKPASTLLHCGPGLANGLGNLHNTRRARSGRAVVGPRPRENSRACGRARGRSRQGRSSRTGTRCSGRGASRGGGARTPIFSSRTLTTRSRRPPVWKSGGCNAP